MRQVVIIVAFLAFGVQSGLSQSYLNLFSVGTQYSPNNSYKNVEGSVDITETTSSFTLPLKKKNGDAFLFGATWNRLTLKQSFSADGKLAGGFNQSKSLTFVLGRFGYSKNWSEKWNMTFLILPKVASDFEEISKEDWQIGGLLLVNKIQKENLKWKFGLYYNHEYFAPFLVPLFGLDWKISEKWRLFGVMPSTMTLERKINEKIRFGANISSPVVSYRFSEQNPIYPSGYMQQTYFTKAKIYSDIYVSKNIVLQPAIGHSVFRNYRAFDKADQSDFSLWGITFGDRTDFRPTNYEELNDGFIFGINLQYRYDLESK